MPDKAVDSPAATRPAESMPDDHSGSRRDLIAHDDGINNPRDGRGPLRPRDDQAVKLPLHPPH